MVSRTAQGVAVVRAGFADRPHTPEGDPDAQRRLCRGMRSGRASRLRDHLLVRTRFFDECVLEAISRGVDQVAIVGAGYDDRALRFRSPGVRFFELDEPGTQADKRRRVERLGGDLSGLEFVPARFGRDSVADLLGRAGQDAGRPTLFICEGLVIYLESDEIVRLLAALAERAGARSELAVSLAVHPEGVPTEAVLRAANAARRRGGRAEPWRTILPAAAHAELLRESGWTPRRTVDDAEIVPSARPYSSLLVRATPA